MANAGQFTVLVGAERNRLDRRRLVADHRIHLRARKLDAHRPVQHSRRERGQQRMRPDISLPAEAAAQKMGHDGDLLDRHAEHDRHQFLGPEDVLGGLIERQRAVRIPDSRSRMRLHLIVMAIRRRVGLFDPHGAVSYSLVGVADRRCDWPEELWRIDGLVGYLAIEYDRLLSLVFRTDQCPGMHRLIARRCDHQCDRLAGVVDLVVLKREVTLAVWMEVAPGLGCWVHPRHVAMCKHHQYTRCLLGGGDIDRYRPPVCNDAMDDGGVYGAHERDIRRVTRAAGHLQPSVGA